jgi:hypothetical protein
LETLLHIWGIRVFLYGLYFRVRVDLRWIIACGWTCHRIALARHLLEYSPNYLKRHDTLKMKDIEKDGKSVRLQLRGGSLEERYEFLSVSSKLLASGIVSRWREHENQW